MRTSLPARAAPTKRGALRAPITFACARHAAFALAIALAATAPAAAEPLDIRARPVPLNPANRAQTRIGALEYMGGLVLSSGDHRFGGLSGLAIDADGTRMIAVSDRGHWITARPVYDAEGRLADVTDGAIYPIRDVAGQAVVWPWNDAEEIARLADGRLAVSFERRHRLWAYDDGDGLATAGAHAMRALHELAAAPANGGVEALTALADGRLLAVSEKYFQRPGVLNAWIFSSDDGKAGRLTYAAPTDFHPTSLATLADGDVLALERRFTVIAGPGARLVRIDADIIAPGATLSGREIAYLAQPLAVDNFEGLAVRNGAGGAVHLYLVSDNNFSPLQRTLLMHFRLRE